MINKKIGFFASDRNGCGWYRTKLIADYLGQNHEWFYPSSLLKDGTVTRSKDREFIKNIIESEIIVIQRHQNEFFLEEIPYLQAGGRKVVYDLDDDLWNIPSSNPASIKFNSKMLKLMKKIIKLCDHVTVSTEPLKNYLLSNGFNNNITVIPNMLVDVMPTKTRNNSKIRIGYTGSPTHQGDFSSELCKALREVKRRYDCELIFAGYNPVKGSETYYNKEGVEIHQYLPYLDSLDLDIAIAPLANNTFNQSKSNLKFLEYSACGYATIASNVYPYSNTIINNSWHDMTGNLIYSEKQWLESIEYSLKNKSIRDEISFSSRIFVRDNFTYKNAGWEIEEKWEGIIKELYK